MMSTPVYLPNPELDALPEEESHLEDLPIYMQPVIQTYTEDELFDQLGPVQAGSVAGDSVF